MTAKARITADFATPKDVASRLRIPPSRTAQLRRQLFDLHTVTVDKAPIVIGEVVKIRAKAVKAKKK
jgi:hypothetical protein